MADLCGQHSLPLQQVMDAAGLKPPTSIGTISSGPPPVIQRQPRKSSFEPLDWEPPS